MAGLTFATETSRTTEDRELPQSFYISFSPLAQDSQQATWQRVNSALLNSLVQAGFSQPQEAIEEEYRPPEDKWRLVAPGMMVREPEFERRFSHLNLVELEGKLSPALFRVFVRNMGILGGPEGLDVSLLEEDE